MEKGTWKHALYNTRSVRRGFNRPIDPLDPAALAFAWRTPSNQFPLRVSYLYDLMHLPARGARAHQQEVRPAEFAIPARVRQIMELGIAVRPIEAGFWFVNAEASLGCQIGNNRSSTTHVLQYHNGASSDAKQQSLHNSRSHFLHLSCGAASYLLILSGAKHHSHLHGADALETCGVSSHGISAR